MNSVFPSNHLEGAVKRHLPGGRMDSWKVEIRNILFVIFIPILGLMFWLRAQEPQSPSQILGLEKELYTVIKVIDGDTINVGVHGRTETIRLIGIDTPEVNSPQGKKECFGTEAALKTKVLLEGKSVTLEMDPTQGTRDKYQRLLHYVFLEDGTHINHLLVREGFAREYTYQRKPYKYQRMFQETEREARKQKIGMWSEQCVP